AGSESGGHKHPAPGAFRTSCRRRTRANNALVTWFSENWQHGYGSLLSRLLASARLLISTKALVSRAPRPSHEDWKAVRFIFQLQKSADFLICIRNSLVQNI